MQQFLTGSPEAFSELEAEAKGVCVRFKNRQMPPGASPKFADIGFEVDDCGAAKLYVSYGVNYLRDNQDVRNWFCSGVIQFPSFQELVDWIKGPLSLAFTEQDSESGSLAGTITDMDAVNAAMSDRQDAVYLDEEALYLEIKGRVLGQDNALRSVSSAVSKHLAKKHPARPAVLFAVGPTGVGKTKTAEVLASLLQGEESRYQYLRLDMSEYQEAHRISQLFGAPQGYIGHGEGSQLIDALSANPNMVILFDEIEKAHESILKSLMNVMEGRLSSPSRGTHGREIDCKKSILIFTSNLDAEAILDDLENRNSFGNRAVEDEICRRRLRTARIAPEIIGRISRFLVYRPLDAKTRAEIIVLAITEVAKEYGITVAYVEPGIVLDVMKKSRSQEFGVRPEKYLIDDMLGSAFATAAQKKLNCPIKITGSPYECVQYCPNTGKKNQEEPQ